VEAAKAKGTAASASKVERVEARELYARHRTSGSGAECAMIQTIDATSEYPRYWSTHLSGC
jgi:hypothetical protein